MAHAVIILDAIVKQQLRTLFTCFPPRRYATSWRLAGKLSQHVICLVKNLALLFNGHVRRVLVRVAMEADLMTSITYGGHILRKRLEAVAWNEPCRFDVIFG